VVDMLLRELKIRNISSFKTVPDTVGIGLEYCCDKDDDLWMLSDTALKQLAEDELCKMGIIERKDIIDGTVISAQSVPFTLGTYSQISVNRDYVDSFTNLFLACCNLKYVDLTSISNGDMGKFCPERCDVQ